MSLPLLHSPADILRRTFIANALGVDPLIGGQWPIYATNEPSMPDEVLTVYDTAWQDDGRAMVDGEEFRHYGFQVRVRSGDHPTGWVKAFAVRYYLAEGLYDWEITIDGALYRVWCANGNDIIVLGKDTPTSKRSLFTINAVAPIERLV